MKTFTIELDQEIVNTIQKLDFEVKAREFIIRTIIESKNEINPETFKKYHEEYVDYFSQFEMAKQMVSTELVPEPLRIHSIQWVVDYTSKTLNITQNCDCEVVI
jgi:hypothetical protein